jgi:DNA-binding transcriptional MerR regulator
MSDRNPTTDANLTVGQFGRLAGLSRKALRLYDNRRLLPPARVDARSGYRYYARTQVTVARRIKLLRMMAMPLEDIAAVLDTWEGDPLKAQRLVQAHVNSLRKNFDLAEMALRLLNTDFSVQKEPEMTFDFVEKEMPAQTVVSIRRRISAPAYHEWIMPALNELWDHIKAAGAEPAGDAIALYYGPVNEKDDGPVEICVPFTGMVAPKGEIRTRELPAHSALQITTYGEYNEYPKVLEMWDAIGQQVHQRGLEGNWEGDLTTYEIWHADETMTIGWPVRAFAPAPA